MTAHARSDWAGRSDWTGLSLELRDLTVGRSGAALLQNLSLHLSAGQVLVLRGPNGLGKTTLLRCLAGLLPPLAGQVLLAPETVTYAAHSDGVKSMLSVAENLQFWADVHGVASIEAAMAAMNLSALAHRRAAELSAGQRRRLGLARLMVTGRWLWLLDEPTVSLDAASVALFGAMLKAHLGKGGAAVIATHIDLGIDDATEVNLQPFAAKDHIPGLGGFDEALI